MATINTKPLYQFYRFLSRPRMDWRKLLYRTVQSFFHIVNQESVDPEQERFFILDDTTLEKSGISMEGISRVFDHVQHKSILGYKLLLLAITDTKSTDAAQGCEERFHRQISPNG